MDIKLGIRPEFFMDDSLVEGESSLARIENLKIELVEPLGFDREFDVKKGRQTFKAKLDLRTSAQEGEIINLCFDMENTHFFDMKTGKNLFL
jgi:ABC-type sugar transport system ATPase subunit